MTYFVIYLAAVAIAIAVNYVLCSVNPKDDDPS
jgi:hypothetical protein